LTGQPNKPYVAKLLATQAECESEHEKISRVTVDKSSRILKSIGFTIIGNKNYLIIEKAQGISGIDFLLSEEKSKNDIQKFALELARGIKEIHENNFCHGDIKLDNVFFDGKTIGMIDFGFSEKISEEMRSEDIKNWANSIFRLMTFGDGSSLNSSSQKSINPNEVMSFKGNTVNDPFYEVNPNCDEEVDFCNRIKVLDNCNNLDEIVLHVMLQPRSNIPKLASIIKRIQDTCE
jgi:serine/threonine protein kinase